MIRLFMAFIRYPLGPDWAARKLARAGHAKRRAFIRSTARQMRLEMGLPPDSRLAG